MREQAGIWRYHLHFRIKGDKSFRSFDFQTDTDNLLVAKQRAEQFFGVPVAVWGNCSRGVCQRVIRE